MIRFFGILRQEIVKAAAWRLILMRLVNRPTFGVSARKCALMLSFAVKYVRTENDVFYQELIVKVQRGIFRVKVT